MKSLFYTALLACSVLAAKAQPNTFPFPSTGSVGIGTNTPATTLHVVAPAVNGVGEDILKTGVSDASDFFKISNANTINNTFIPALWGHNNSNLTGLQTIGSVTPAGDNGSYPVMNFIAKTYYNGTSAAVVNKPAFQFTNYATNLLTIAANGNIGIGTTSPTTRLDLRGGDLALNDGKILFRPSDNKHGLAYKLTYGVSPTGTPISVDGPVLWGLGGGALGVNNWGNERIALSWNADGHVSIGFQRYSGTTHSDYHLSVDGKVIAPSFYALDPGNWPDYVFEKGYQLPSLEEVEAFVVKNKHLAEVPSAQEVNSNGVNLLQMDAILLKKVEELTLHMIEMKKEMKQLESENEALKTAIKTMSK